MTNASVIKKEMIKKWVLVLVVVVMVGSVISDVDKDKEECADQLVGLATCLPYVSETAKSPTPDCCSGLKKVLDTSKKCLCVLVKDRNDPGLGFKINSTLALSLPSTCKVPANISECPALLHLAPNSPAAQVFEQFGSSSKGATTTPTSSGSPKSGGTSGEASNKKVKSDGGRRNKVELVEGFLLLCFISIYLSFV